MASRWCSTLAWRCYTREVPTARPRHTITESDEVARYLDDASTRWPEADGHRGQLLIRLLAEGHRAIEREHDVEVTRRQEAVRATSGVLTGSYPPKYLEELRDDWPG